MARVKKQKELPSIRIVDEGEHCATYVHWPEDMDLENFSKMCLMLLDRQLVGNLCMAIRAEGERTGRSQSAYLLLAIIEQYLTNLDDSPVVKPSEVFSRGEL